MRTHGHREGSITHWGLLEDPEEAQHGDGEVAEGKHAEKCHSKVGKGYEQTLYKRRHT